MWDRDMAYFGVTNRQHTPMMGLFGTLVEQQYACSVCGQASISTVVEPTLILGLVNGDRRSVQDRLRMEYGLTETLSEPKSKCDACGRSRVSCCVNHQSPSFIKCIHSQLLFISICYLSVSIADSEADNETRPQKSAHDSRRHVEAILRHRWHFS